MFKVQFFQIENYQQFTNCRDDGQGGGCAVYVRNEITCNLIKNYDAFNTIALEIQEK